MLVAAAYAAPLRASISPEGLKRTSAANPVYAVWDPLERPITLLIPVADGVASNCTVKFPLWEANEVFCHGPPWVTVTQPPPPAFTVRAI